MTRLTTLSMLILLFGQFFISISAEPYQIEQVYQDSALRVGVEPHLFIDDTGISRMEDVEFIVNPPLVRQIVMKAEYPWENPSEYTNVLDDGTGVYKMYYMNNFNPISNVALATSTDGMNWEKPKLGAVEYDGSKDNNIVMTDFVGYPGGNVMYDPHDPNPEYRYKYMTNFGVDDKPDTPYVEGIVVYTSPDGIHFKKHEVQLFPYMGDAQTLFFWDFNINKYVAYIRGSDMLMPDGGRTVLRAETDRPLEPWPHTLNPNPFFGTDHELPNFSYELPTVMRADERDPWNTDLYSSQVVIYTWAPRVYLAFPTWYYHYKDSKERVFLSPDNEGGNKGVGEVQLLTSRDGIDWDRHRRPAYIKHGWHGDHYTAWPWMFQGMIRNGDTIFQFGNLRSAGHGTIKPAFLEGSSGRLQGYVAFEQKLHRFVAAEFDYDGGTIVTEPLIFEGNRLELNVDTGAMGEGRVALLRADGSPIEDFMSHDCDIINGDWLHKTVSWRFGDSDVGAWAGKPVRLMFNLRGARLYAFQFIAQSPADGD